MCTGDTFVGGEISGGFANGVYFLSQLLLGSYYFVVTDL